MSDSDKDWTPPTVEELQAMLPQYEVTALWGRGGMGAVYKGVQKSLHRDVAIKVLPETFATGESGSDPHQFVERFKLEARSMANLDHPAILSVYDFGQTENGQLYIVMEFIDGMDIYAYLQHHGGKLPHEHAVAICSHVLDALQYAHDSGVIHRDIKPSNVLINSQGRVKLADFGLAKRIAETDGEDSGAPMTMPDVAMGTPDFVAPETLDSDLKPDGRADLYAVGVMLYQLLTGKLPRGHFELPSELLPDLDPRFDDVVTHALQANPDSRYPSATAFRADLDKILSQPIPKAADPTSAEIPLVKLAERSAPKVMVLGNTRKRTTGHTAPVPAEVEMEKKSKASLFIGIGLAAVLLIGVGVYLLTRPGDSEKGPELVAEEPGAPTSPSTPKPQPTPAKPPEPVPEPTEPPAPEPEKPSTTAPATTSAPSEPTKPEPVPEPKPTTPDTPAPSPPAIPETPEAKPEPKEDPASKIFELVALRKRFDQLKAERIGALDANYLKAIERELNTAADAGDLKTVTALELEKKRLAEKKPVPESDPAGTGRALVDLWKIYRPARAKEESTLLGQYQTALKQLEADLTKKRKFEEARVVSAFRESLVTPETVVVVAPKLEPAKPAPSPDPASSTTNTAMASRKATKEKPFENSLGMRFVPVPITGGPSDMKIVLFSIWETRVKDYEKFIKRDRKRDWPEPDFKQEDDHPAVMVNPEDADAFCEWLTEEDRKKGRIGKEQHYRLPTDHEWSCAVGIGQREDPAVAPSSKIKKIANVYPWGTQWPPPKGAGNYYGKETENTPVAAPKPDQIPIEGYDDTFDRTAPVGSFQPNEYGIFDMGGNAWEICADWYSGTQGFRLRRGGAWTTYSKDVLFSCFRAATQLTSRYYENGFRAVLDTGVLAPKAPSVTQTPPPATPQIDRGALKLASKERPFVNSLGMKFVPVPITGGPTDTKKSGKTVLFSIWETRVEDYAAYAAANPGVDVQWKDVEVQGHKQEPDHPVVMVSWEDAMAYCGWLSEKEGLRYRLPFDHEWSCAVGIGRDEDAGASPKDKHDKNHKVYPWGTDWPPPRRTGNFAGEESLREEKIKGYRDDYPFTAPVGSYRSNDFGVFDLAGNVHEHCGDSFESGKENRPVMRGGSYDVTYGGGLNSSGRGPGFPHVRVPDAGFRVVIEFDPDNPSPTKPTYFPSVIKAALEKKPGQLYGFGTVSGGKPLTLTTASEFDDFVEIRAAGASSWMALRANGDFIRDVDDGGELFKRKIVKLGTGQNHFGLVGVVGIDDRGNAEIARPRIPFENRIQSKLRNIVEISTGVSSDQPHALALTSKGEVIAWGPPYDEGGAIPPPDHALSDVKSVATFGRECYVVKTDGTVVGWIAGGQSISIPDKLRDVTKVAAGSYFCLGLTATGQVHAWEYRGTGADEVPANLGKAIAIRAGGYVAAAQMENGSWIAWGDNSYGAVETINKVGPVTDLSFTSSPNSNGFVLWIKADVE